MKTSKTLEQILKVLELLKESLLADLSAGKEVSTDEAEDRIKHIFKEVAHRFNVTLSTIISQCTRDLGNLTSAEFYNLAVRYITRQDNVLEGIIVDNIKYTIDDPVQVRIMLKDIRDN